MKLLTLVSLVFFCIANHAITPTEGQETSSTGSVLSSLLQTLSSSDQSPLCPGRCFNAIAALACQEVLDNPGLCPKTGYRCCKNLAEQENEKEEEKKENNNKSTAEPAPAKKLGGNSLQPQKSEDLNASSPKKEPRLEDLPNQKLIVKQTENNEDLSTIKEKIGDDDEEPQLYAGPSRVDVCPGVCVAQRISNFCEAVIDVAGLCKTQLKCCVPSKLYDGVDHPPKEFIILNPSSDDGENNNTAEEARNEMTETPKQETPVLTTPTTTTTTTTTVQTTTTTERRSTAAQSAGKVDEASSPVEDDGIPPEKKCKGTCVAGFFAFLCDSIDRTGECEGGGKCCVTQRKAKPGKGDKNEVDTDETLPERPPPRKTTTTSAPKRRTTTAKVTTTETPRPRSPTTTTRATTVVPRTTTEPPPPPCSGTCLPVDQVSRCQHPSRLVASIGCSEDDICCEGYAKSPAAIQPPKKPIKQIPETPLGSLWSLFGGGSNEKRPPAPPKRTSPPPSTTTTIATTTTTPAPTTIATVRPECSGTCIAPILSFTCFGNAEMTELFKCSKDKQSCCAPKSAIRELTRQHEMTNIARNDTVFPSEDSHYPLPPTVIRPPYGGYPPEEDYQNPYYKYHPQEHSSYQQHQYSPSIPTHQTMDKQPLKEHQNYHKISSTQSPLPPNNQALQHGQYNGVPHSSHPLPPLQPQHGPPQPHYNHESDGRQPYVPSHPSVSHDGDTSSSAQVPFFGASPHVDNKYVCGVKGTNRVGKVVGGEDAVPGEWCWQVALINSLNQYLCGGALIGGQWVLTAAHCVTNIVRSGDAIYVRVGDHDLTTRFGSPGAQTLPVATTYIHHNHNSQTLDNDIALLKLSSEAALGNGVCLACLPARGVSQVAGKRCTVTGYGYMGETGPIPLRVREAEIPVVSDNECVRKINAVTEKIFILPASSFCAGGESGHDACQGDGGGPLVCNVDGYFELSGLVSWGFGCGRQDVPGVYVKVSSFIGWVNQIISVNNS